MKLLYMSMTKTSPTAGPAPGYLAGATVLAQVLMNDKLASALSTRPVLTASIVLSVSMPASP